MITELLGSWNKAADNIIKKLSESKTHKRKKMQAIEKILGIQINVKLSIIKSHLNNCKIEYAREKAVNHDAKFSYQITEEALQSIILKESKGKVKQMTNTSSISSKIKIK